MDTFHTVQEIAKSLKFSEEYVRRLLRKGKLAGTKFDTDWRISDADLQQFVADHKKQGWQTDA